MVCICNVDIWNSLDGGVLRMAYGRSMINSGRLKVHIALVELNRIVIYVIDRSENCVTMFLVRRHASLSWIIFLTLDRSNDRV